ncbi:MAG TPA: hypothetical protein ACFYEK_11015 [Candidatus Wunengus sp. YC60]|uniref:hypothetical protein n=1 Tax=Candidatus Wunengus sp. YC60 TaxID=3367697 RepID=UPI004026A1CE
MRKKTIMVYLDPEKNELIRDMAKEYKVSINSLFGEAVDVIIRNKEKLDKIYLGKEKK